MTHVVKNVVKTTSHVYTKMHHFKAKIPKIFYTPLVATVLSAPLPYYSPQWNSWLRPCVDV